MRKLRSLDDARKRLHARRYDLLSRYRDMIDRAQDAATAEEPDVLDRAENEWDARVLSLMSDTDARALADVVAALRRIERGEYGSCTRCGTKIDHHRLETLPEAALCWECASEAEQRAPRSTFETGARQ